MNNRFLYPSLVAVASGVALLATSAPALAVASPPTLMVFSASATDTTAATNLAVAAGVDPDSAYLDSAGHVHVVVTSSASATTVHDRGGIPQLASRSISNLKQMENGIGSALKIPGTGYGIDPTTDQIVVNAYQGMPATQMAQVRDEVAHLGSAARLQISAAPMRPQESGGDAILGPELSNPNLATICSLGFNVQMGSTKFFLTAGHCTAGANTWFTQVTRQSLGNDFNSQWPQHDWGLVQWSPLSAVVHNGDVDLFNGSHQDITRVANPIVGQYVLRAGQTTHLHYGYVEELNFHVTYATGQTFTDMILASVCSAGGDSGGPLFNGTTGYGILSGGNGLPCGKDGGQSEYEPAVAALANLNASVY